MRDGFADHVGPAVAADVRSKASSSQTLEPTFSPHAPSPDRISFLRCDAQLVS
jgi:hypothetical protein